VRTILQPRGERKCVFNAASCNALSVKFANASVGNVSEWREEYARCAFIEHVCGRALVIEADQASVAQDVAVFETGAGGGDEGRAGVCGKVNKLIRIHSLFSQYVSARNGGILL
jgi:hypothetical protein